MKVGLVGVVDGCGDGSRPRTLGVLDGSGGGSRRFYMVVGGAVWLLVMIVSGSTWLWVASSSSGSRGF